jgi:hypothetical protein
MTLGTGLVTVRADGKGWGAFSEPPLAPDVSERVLRELGQLHATCPCWGRLASGWRAKKCAWPLPPAGRSCSKGGYHATTEG